MPNDYPIEVCAAKAAPFVARGHSFFQKFTCEQCGSRQMMEEENVWFETGRCEECGHITSIRDRGCNYALHLRMRRR